jgi:imidazolonepropionase-like amidohydrolase
MAPRACGSVVRSRARTSGRGAQGAAAPARLPELLGQLSQQVLAGQVAAGAGDLVAQHAGIGKVLKERDQVGERLVKRQHVGVHGLVEAGVHAVQQRVRDLVGDDVMRKAGEHQGARRVAGVFDADRKVAEQERLLFRAVVRVAVAQGVRVDAQPPHELLVVRPLRPPR